MSLLGVMQAVSHAQVCCITIRREDKARIRELVRQVRKTVKTASEAEAVMLHLEKTGVDQSLPAEEQLKQYRALYVQGVISRAAYDLKRDCRAGSKVNAIKLSGTGMQSIPGSFRLGIYKGLRLDPAGKKIYDKKVPDIRSPS